jgi:PEP-CTERM motif
MKNAILIACGALGMCLMSVQAFAGTTDSISVPEPLSLTLLAGGVAAIAVVKRYRRK